MFEQSFPRELAALEPIRDFVRGALKEWSVAESVAWDVDLVLEELFTNVIKYGNGSSAPVTVSLDWHSPLLTIHLRDTDSDFFDPTAVPSPDIRRPIEQRTAGGLGLHIIRRMAEKFAYKYEGRVSLTTVTLRLET